MTDRYDLAIQNIGKYALPIALLLWGMASARKRGVQSGRNAPAYRGLVFALGSWALVLLGVAFAPMLPKAITLLALASVVLCAAWATALGIIGLAQLQRFRSGALAGATSVLIGFGLAGYLGWGLLGYLHARHEVLSPANAAAEVPEIGLRITPPVEWVVTEPTKLNPNAKLGYVRTAPNMGLIILAVRAEPGQTIEPSNAYRYLRSGLSIPDSAKLAERSLTLGGRLGVMLTIDSAGPGRAANYCVWLSTTATDAVFVIVSAKASVTSPAQLAAEADRLFRTIEFREPTSASTRMSGPPADRPR